MRSFRPFFLPLLGFGLSLGLGLGLSSSALAQAITQTYSELDMTPPSAISRSTNLAASSPKTVVHIAVSLPYADRGAMAKFVDSVSDPKSPNYHQFLTPEQVGQRFGLTTVQVGKVVDFLKSNGLTVKSVAKNRLAIMADGTVQQMEQAFHIKLREFRINRPLAGEPNTFRGFTGAPSVPASIKALITDVSGLETYTHPKAKYLVPGQIRSLYNIAPLYSAGKNGQGRTVAISSWDGFRLSGLTNFYSQFSLPTPAGGVGSNVTVVKIGTGSGAGPTQGEADLDIQTILGVAPLVNLIIYDGTGTNLIEVLTAESNANAADIISESYGWSFGSDSGGIAANNIHLSMNAQGMTYMAASGDSGTTITPYSYPDYDPEVLSVGGTTAAVNGSGVRTTETGWSGSGGGWVVNSQTFNILPSWQHGTGVPTNVNRRLVPDVALNADPNTGYVVYLAGASTPGFYVIGGTSGASPTFAGALAVAQQQMISLGTLPVNGSGKYRHGRIQDLLYSFNGNPSLFFDITSGNNGNLPSGAASNATAKWDFVTGWGALDFKAFSDSGYVPPVVQILSVSPTTVVGGSATTVTGTVTLDKVAPTGGSTVSLTSSDTGAASTPASVVVAAGTSSKTFTVTTLAVASNKTVTLTGTLGASSKTATLTVTPPAPPTTLTLTSAAAKVASLGSVTGTVTLDNPAPTGGFVVTLSSSRPSTLSVPASVTVAAGTVTKTFTMTAATTSALVRVTVTASHTGFTNSSVKVDVIPPAVSSLALSTTSVTGGNSLTGTVTLASAATTGGQVVTISSTLSSVATVPASITIPEGQTVGTFTINTVGVAAVKYSTIGAITPYTLMAKKDLKILSAVPSALTVNPNPVMGGSSATATVTINGLAPAGGLVITLTSGKPTVMSVPATVTVPAGTNTVTFTVNTTVVSLDKVVNLKAAIGSSTGVTTAVTIKH